MFVNNKNGITLIALVITIIVLLILAGISLSLVLGNNGVLKKAADAKIRNTQSTTKEQIQLEVAGSYDINEYKIDENKLRLNLENIGAKVNGNKFPITAELNGFEFSIKSNGDVVEAGEEAKINVTVGDYVTYIPPQNSNGTKKSYYLTSQLSGETGRYSANIYIYTKCIIFGEY